MTGFSCLQCGACCRIPGFVRLGPGDAARLAGHLGLGEDAFADRYARLGPDRRSLRLADGVGDACVFLGAGGKCTVYPARPEQCRGFPMQWRYATADRVCPGLRALSADGGDAAPGDGGQGAGA